MRKIKQIPEETLEEAKREALKEMRTHMIKKILPKLDASILQSAIYLMADWLKKHHNWNFQKYYLEAIAQGFEIDRETAFRRDIERVTAKLQSLMIFYGAKIIEPTTQYTTTSNPPQIFYVENAEGKRLREKFDIKKAKAYSSFYLQEIEGKLYSFDCIHPSVIYELTRPYQVERYIELRNAIHKFFKNVTNTIKGEWIIGVVK